MGLMIFGLLIFFGIHLVPAQVSWRQQFIEKHSLTTYKGLFALVAAIGLVLIVIGKANADFISVWNPVPWSRPVAMGIVLVAFVLFAATELPGNIKRFTRHPMLWGITLWSGAHLQANGDLASMLLFGSFFVYALFAMWSANRRGAKKRDKVYPVSRDIVAAAIGIVVYVIVLLLHPWLFGYAIV